MISEGTALVRLNRPRSRPRRSDRGKTRKVCAECSARKIDMAKPNSAYVPTAAGSVLDNAIPASPANDTIAHATSGASGRVFRSAQRPVHSATGADNTSTALKILAERLSLIAESIERNQK